MDTVNPSRLEPARFAVGAVVYTFTGFLWGLLFILSLGIGYRALAAVGVVIPGLLLLAYVTGLVKAVRMDAVAVDMREAGTFQWELRRMVLVIAGTGLAIGASAVILAVAGRASWTAPAAALLFAAHVFLVPPGLRLYVDYLLAAGMVIVVFAGTLLFADRSVGVWVLPGLSSLLFCWLAAALRVHQGQLKRSLQPEAETTEDPASSG